MPEYRYKYFLPANGEKLDDAREFTSSWDGSKDFHGHWIAEAAAECDHDCHDGWESRWPQVFEVYTLDDCLVGRFSVDREAVPEFHASTVP